MGTTENKHAIYVDGRVRVCRRMCKTCIFRPGNAMHLDAGRVDEMVAEATADPSGSIVCHSTLDQDRQAVCRGFYDRHATPVLTLAAVTGVLLEVEP